MSCRETYDVEINATMTTLACELPGQHTGMHRQTLPSGTLVSWPNTERCSTQTQARGWPEQCRLNKNHGSPHMTEDGGHLWVEGLDTVVMPREQGPKPVYADAFDRFRIGPLQSVRLDEVIVRTEEQVARTYQERKRRSKR